MYQGYYFLWNSSKTDYGNNNKISPEEEIVEMIVIYKLEGENETLDALSHECFEINKFMKLGACVYMFFA